MAKVNLVKTLNDFVGINDRLAKKYKSKASIVFRGKETVLADHREKKKGGRCGKEN